MKFYFAMEKIMFTFFLITGEIKCNLISEEVQVKRPIKKFKQTRVWYRDKRFGGNNTGIY